jgi:3-polyprenyl-4-hydroxybenzoate decarboxylase
LINFAIGESKSEIYHQTQAAIPPEVEQLVGTVIENATVEELLQSLPEMFFEWLEPGQWGQVWRSVSIQQQAKVLSVLLLLLPPRQFSFFA